MYVCVQVQHQILSALFILQIQLVHAFIPSKTILHIVLIRIFYSVIFMHVSAQVYHEVTESVKRVNGGRSRGDVRGRGLMIDSSWCGRSQVSLALMTICTHDDLLSSLCKPVCGNLLSFGSLLSLRYYYIFYWYFELFYFWFIFNPNHLVHVVKLILLNA